MTVEDLLIEPVQKAGFAAESDGDLSVIMDTNLTPELISEGYVRELISKVQTMRKEAGFEVTDHITLYISAEEALMDVVKANQTKIMSEVLAENIADTKGGGYEKTWDINGIEAVVMVERV